MTVRETWRVHVTQVRAYSAFTACVCTWTCAYTCWRIAAGPNACVCVGHHVAAVCVLLLALTREKNVHAWPVRFTCAHTKLECKEAQSHRVPPSRSTRSSWLEITGPRGEGTDLIAGSRFHGERVLFTQGAGLAPNFDIPSSRVKSQKSLRSFLLLLLLFYFVSFRINGRKLYVRRSVVLDRGRKDTGDGVLPPSF